MEVVNLFFLIAMFSCVIQMSHGILEPTAKINNSRIIGQRVTFGGLPVHQYLGVPYAEPPLGELRFQKTKPIEGYPSEFRAVTNPPACFQYSTMKIPWYAGDRLVNGPGNSEDCLYLNIWAPVTAGKLNKKAVMYWIHGGTYRYGGIRAPVYDGTRLAALGDIIVVTVNYRLGYLGFFTSNTTDAPGNAGVWDVLEGLRWVNKYIAAFGGDVSRITISGEDAGAIDVGLLSISPLAKGLFARQIMQSGSPAYRNADNNTQNLKLSQQIAVEMGCSYGKRTIYDNPKEVVKCMQEYKYPFIFGSNDFAFAPKTEYHLLPQFGDEILQENPRLSVINNNFGCTDLLIGSNGDEGAYKLTSYEYRSYFDKHDEPNPHVNRSLGESIIRTAVASFPDPEAIVDYYLPPTLQNDTDYRIRHQVYTALGDTAQICPAVYYAEKCAEQNKKVYHYLFNHRPSNSPWPTWMGFTHFEEVQFVFGQPLLNATYKESEMILSLQIMGIWSSFVKYGKPGITWPVYSKENPIFRYIRLDFITDLFTYGQGPHAENCKFLRPHFGL